MLLCVAVGVVVVAVGGNAGSTRSERDRDCEERSTSRADHGGLPLRGGASINDGAARNL
jgi:hypothetical protein